MRTYRTVAGICLVAGIAISTVPSAYAAPPSGPTNQQQSQVKSSGDSSLAQASGQAEDTPSTVEPTTDRLVVKFKDSTPEDTKSQLLQKTDDVAPSETSKLLKATANQSDVVQMSKKLDATAQDKVVSKLEEDPAVEYAEPDRIVKNAASSYPSTPNDPMYSSNQWNLRTIGASGAWQHATGAGQTIGVVDTGITDHPDLNAKVTGGYDFVSPDYDRDGTSGRDGDPSDPGVLNASENWHGTHVAGIAGASTNNGIGISGVAPDATIEPVRALGIGASGYESDFADAITWASGGAVAGAPANPHPSSVVNFSAAWDGQCSATMKSAVDGAHARNVPVVVAAGNAGVNANDVTPANCLGAIVVGASASTDVMTGYSNWGPMLDVLAPGGTTGADIYSTYNTGNESPAQASYGPLNGTSMSAPHVAGVIALMKQRDPGLDVESIRNTLVSTGAGVNGYSRINAEAAVSAVESVDSGPVVVNGIKELYDTQGGAAKFGTPRNNESGGLVDGGVFQEFSNNYTIYWTPFTGTHSVNFSGAIGAKFRDGGYENTYGYPTSEEVSADGYAYQWFRTASGRSNLMMWTPSDGAHTIIETGAIGGAWIENGRESGWGKPTTDEFQGSDGKIHQRFSNGVEVTWTADEGIRVLS